MEEELRHNPNAIFITLTLEDKWYKEMLPVAEAEYAKHLTELEVG